MRRLLIACVLPFAAGLVPAGACRGGGPSPTRSATRPAARPAVGATAKSWPIFRGSPGMLGVAPGELPKAFRLAWKFKTGGPVTSSAVIAGGRVFIGSGDGSVYCLDLAKRRKVWSYKTGDAVDAPPTCAGDTVYVGSRDGFLYALGAADGKLKWKFETEAEILGAANAFRDAKTGKLRIVLGSYDFNLYCLDAKTGKPLWKYRTENYINGGVAVAGGRTVLGGCDARIHVVPPDGKNARTVDAGAYVAATPAFDGRRVFLGNYEGGFVCADVVAGKASWSFEGDEPFVSSPAVGKDRVVVGCRDYRLYCFDRGSGKKLWTFPTRDEINSSPVICGQKVVFGSNDGRLYVVRLADGKKVWSYDLGEPVGSSPAVAAGYVVVGCDDGYVYAFAGRP
jgi:outer membrane protein assembly factor BamB